MVSATSSPAHKRAALPPHAARNVAWLVRTLRNDHRPGVPLLVLRLPELERIAWREGRRAARQLERRSLQAFVETAAQTLRHADLFAHDDESEIFLVALLAPTRNSGSIAMPADRRATLARLASAMELATGLHVETGWTVADRLDVDPVLAKAIEDALERGARERERYAFFSTVGHELRTPLTSIRGYLETLIDGDLDDATRRRFLEIAQTEALRLGRLVESMFDASLLDLREPAVERESSDVGSAIRAAINITSPFAATRSVSVTSRGSETARVALGADRLTQVIVNLLDNAIKHGRQSGDVEIFACDVGRYVEVWVDDDGPGVPGQERETVFKLAQRGSTSVAKGSGIGLAVVRLMLERIGGEVEVTDAPSGGARFRLRLPCDRGTD